MQNFFLFFSFFFLLHFFISKLMHSKFHIIYTAKLINANLVTDLTISKTTIPSLKFIPHQHQRKSKRIQRIKMLKNKNLSTATRTSSIRAVLDDFKQTSTTRQTPRTLKHNAIQANQSTAIFQPVHQNGGKKKTRHTGDKELVIGNRRGRTGFRRKNSMGRRI